MALSLLVNREDPNKIQDLEIDTTLREVHEYTNTVTTNPVEEGADTSDHVKQEPVRLIIEGLTTNTPVKFFAGAIGNFVRNDNTNRAQLAFNVLLDYAGYSPPKQPGDTVERVSDPQIITVVTALKVYTNMVITRLTFPRDRTTGEAVNYNVELQKIRKVDSRFAFIQTSSNLNGRAPSVETQSPATVSTGKDTPKQVETSTLLTIGRNLVSATKNVLGGP